MSGGISATTVMAAASIAATAGSAVMGAVSSSQQSAAQAAQARQQADAARYQAAVAENQRLVLQWQAQDAEKRGKIAEDQRRTKTRLQIGAQRAALASMGGDINSGSAVDIVGDTASVGEFDALTIRSNYQRDAWDKKVQAANAGSDAAMADFAAAGYRSRAESYESNSWVGVGANLIAGASTVSDKWLHYKTKLPGW
jgi:hypothetical protein